MGKTTRETIAVALMGAPFVVAVISAAIILPTAPSVVNIHFERNGAVDGTAPTWLIVAIALVLSLGSIILAIAGLRTSWQVNRRVQRGLAGGAAAVATVVWISTIGLTAAGVVSADEAAPPVILAILLAVLWGALCLVVTPPDLLPEYETAEDPTLATHD